MTIISLPLFSSLRLIFSWLSFFSIRIGALSVPDLLVMYALSKIGGLRSPVPKVPLVDDDPRKKFGWEGSTKFVTAAVDAKKPSTKAKGAMTFPRSAVAFAVQELADVNSMSDVHGSGIRDVDFALGLPIREGLLPRRLSHASAMFPSSSSSSSSSSSLFSSSSAASSSSSSPFSQTVERSHEGLLSPDHTVLRNKKRPHKAGVESLTAMVNYEAGNKGGSGSHKTKEKNKKSSSFGSKSMKRRKISNAQAMDMHGDILSMVEGFTSVERRVVRYLVLGIASQLAGVEITELKQIDFNISFQKPLHQVLYLIA